MSCPHFKNFPHVSVLLKIDENGEFIRTSDRHGSILLRVDQEAEQITATVLHHEHKDHVISIVPVEKVPKHVRFQAISYPVTSQLTKSTSIQISFLTYILIFRLSCPCNWLMATFQTDL